MHVEGVLIGWLMQLALGVAVWILPFSRDVSADRRLWAAWVCLNGGVLLTIGGAAGTGWMLALIGRAAEGGAGLLVAWVLWPRVRALPQRGHGAEARR